MSTQNLSSYKWDVYAILELEPVKQLRCVGGPISSFGAQARHPIPSTFSISTIRSGCASFAFGNSTDVSVTMTTPGREIDRIASRYPVHPTTMSSLDILAEACLCSKCFQDRSEIFIERWRRQLVAGNHWWAEIMALRNRLGSFEVQQKGGMKSLDTNSKVLSSINLDVKSMDKSVETLSHDVQTLKIEIATNTADSKKRLEQGNSSLKAQLAAERKALKRHKEVTKKIFNEQERIIENLRGRLEKEQLQSREQQVEFDGWTKRKQGEMRASFLTEDEVCTATDEEDEYQSAVDDVGEKHAIGPTS